MVLENESSTNFEVSLLHEEYADVVSNVAMFSYTDMSDDHIPVSPGEMCAGRL